MAAPIAGAFRLGENVTGGTSGPMLSLKAYLPLKKKKNERENGTFKPGLSVTSEPCVRENEVIGFLLEDNVLDYKVQKPQIRQ